MRTMTRSMSERALLKTKSGHLKERYKTVCGGGFLLAHTIHVLKLLQIASCAENRKYSHQLVQYGRGLKKLVPP